MIFKEIGRVVRFNPQSGWGFIAMMPCEDEIFVHHSEIRMNGFKELREGDYVMFNVEEGPRGLSATAVYLMPPDDAFKALKAAQI